MSAHSTWQALKESVRAGEMPTAVNLAVQLKKLIGKGEWPLPPNTFMPETADEISGELARARRMAYTVHVEEVTDYFIGLYK